MVSLIYILVAAACFLLWLFPGVRCALTHPFHCIYYGVKDGYNYIRYKQGNLRKTGNLDIFCGYFGNGKTLSLVKQVVCREYKRYDGLTVWCNRRQKFVTQRILILSNVDLCVPYERLTGLAQVCAISKANEIYDDEHDTLTITIVCMDELSVQMNSRSFKDNINAYFLNTLMCCRHYHISFYGSAQRFQHVDKMLRDVTMNVVQCKKVWRFQFNSYYDGFQLENAQDPTLVRPLRRACWFVTDADYNAYDTLQVVDNLQKSFNENDMTKVYDAYVAQKYADYQKTAHSKGLKLGNNHAYAAAVASCIKQKYSPYAAIQLVGDLYGLTVSKQTLYRYIAEGLIPNVSYKHLPVGHPKKRKNAVQADEQPIRARNTLHRSIEQRPKNINLRDVFGHWEIDSIIGSSKGKKESCLVITERMTRQEIVLKVSDKTAVSTTKAMQRLKQKLGRDFNKLFLTISSDNGCEFADQDGFDNLGVPVFYCHPQAPHERGSNENNNKLLRRHFPKGESMKKKTQHDATLAQHFINGYPREMFDGKSSGDLFRDELQKLNLYNPEKVYSFFNLAV